MFVWLCVLCPPFIPHLECERDGVGGWFGFEIVCYLKLNVTHVCDDLFANRLVLDSFATQLILTQSRVCLCVMCIRSRWRKICLISRLNGMLFASVSLISSLPKTESHLYISMHLHRAPNSIIHFRYDARHPVFSRFIHSFDLIIHFRFIASLQQFNAPSHRQSHRQSAGALIVCVVIRIGWATLRRSRIGRRSVSGDRQILGRAQQPDHQERQPSSQPASVRAFPSQAA